jgi:hypothetical protein
MRVANDGHGFTPDVSFCVTSSLQSVQSYPKVLKRELRQPFWEGHESQVN